MNTKILLTEEQLIDIINTYPYFALEDTHDDFDWKPINIPKHIAQHWNLIHDQMPRKSWDLLIGTIIQLLNEELSSPQEPIEDVPF